MFSLVEHEKSFITNYPMVYLSKLGLNPSIPNFLDKIKYFEAGKNSWSAKLCNFVTTIEHATCILHS